MRVLVSGDRGYLGAVLVPFLHSAGHSVEGLDAGWYEGCDFGRGPGETRTLALDIRDVRPDDLRGFDAVVHLAAVSNDPIGHLNPEATYSVNAEGAVHLGRVAKEAGVERYLFSSSCSLYGAAGSAPVDEGGAFNPVTPYGESKVRAEAGLSALADDTFSPTHLRNATAYGSSPRLRADIVVNNLTGTAFTRGEVRLQSDGSPWRPLVHVEDIARAFLAVLEAPREVVHNQAFNVGRDDDVVQIRRHRGAGRGAPERAGHLREGAGPDARNYRVDFSKITAVLPAFEPTVDHCHWALRSSSADMDPLRPHRRGLRGPRFIRLARI